MTDYENNSEVKSPSRRRFLGLAAGAAATAAITGVEGAAGHPVLKAISSVFKEPAKATTTEPGKPLVADVLYPPGHKFGVDSSIKVFIDKEGLPIKYVLPDGKEVEFDMKAARETRDFAISSGEPQILSVIQVPADPEAGVRFKSPFSPSEAKPLIDKLPVDTLTERQLGEHGITVVQGNKTQLYIRESAFKKDGPLESFAQPGRKMTIVLVDGPLVSGDFLSDKKYDGIRNFLSRSKDGIEEHREKQIEDAKEGVEAYRKWLKEALQKSPEERSPQELNYVQSKLISEKSNLELYRRVIDDTELFLDMGAKSKSDGFLGAYYGEAHTGGRGAIVFMAAGDLTFNNDIVTFSFTREGKFGFSQIPGFLRSLEASRGGGSAIPSLHETHPDPANFPIDPNAQPEDKRAYPVMAKPPGFVLRHELAHDELSLRQDPTLGEYQTDMLALDGIRKAWDTWVNSGFKDDTGYQFVFKTPEGYILAKNKEQSKSSEQIGQA